MSEKDKKNSKGDVRKRSIFFFPFLSEGLVGGWRRVMTAKMEIDTFQVRVLEPSNSYFTQNNVLFIIFYFKRAF